MDQMWSGTLLTATSGPFKILIKRLLVSIHSITSAVNTLTIRLVFFHGENVKKLTVALLTLVLLMIPMGLAWWGGPGPAPWSPCRHYWHYPYAQPYAYPPSGNGTNASQGYPIGGPFCSQCHVSPPTVTSIQPTWRYVRVSGTVIKSAPTIAVVVSVNGNVTNVYHIRFPAYCQPPSPGTKISVSGFEVQEATSGHGLVWHMVTLQDRCPQ